MTDPGHGLPARMRISTGTNATTWARFAFMALLMIPAFLFGLLVGISMISVWPPFGVFMILMSLVILGALAFLWARFYQQAYWLEGTVLIQRRPFGSRRCDLSRAHVIAESVSPNSPYNAAPLPRLTAVEPGGRPIRLWLRAPERRNALLPAGELLALAAAITYRRPHDEQARFIAEGLRRLADNPFGAA